MKKTTLISIITVLCIFLCSTLLMAGEKEWKGFHGVYDMIANGSCIHSTGGFDGPGPGALYPFFPNPGDVYAATTMAQATWKFENDGTGTISGTNYVTYFPGGDIEPYVRQNPINTAFDYEVSHNGQITVYTGGLELIGMVSSDHKTMTLGSANQPQDFSVFGLGWVICNTARVLIRIHD